MTHATDTSLEDELTAHEHRWVESWNYKTVYHVGDLDGDRSIPTFSQEGKELSVSTDKTVSDAWGYIAHVGGETYELTNPDSRFYNIDPNTSVTDRELQFCRENGYVDMVDGYRLSEYDSIDEDRYMLFYERENAESEKQGYESGEISEEVVPELDVRGEAYWREAFQKDVCNASPVGVRMLIPIWTASHLDVDGIYWHHPLNRHEYSAPRGLIYQEKLSEWDIETLNQ